MPKSSMIEIKNLSLSYNGLYAFKDISLNCDDKTITAIVGPSGCGKSSFLYCINRLSNEIHNCQVSGQVSIHGVNTSTTNLIELRRKVGMVFQKPNPFPLSIRKNFEFPLKEHGVKNKEQREDITKNSLIEVGLWKEVKDRLNDSALKLSGGQQQRLCIARALSLKPEILLLDEPCSSLDPISSTIVENLIKNLGVKLTIVIVTHNLAQAKRLSQQAALFWNTHGYGELVELGNTDELFNSPKNSLTQKYICGDLC